MKKRNLGKKITPILEKLVKEFGVSKLNKKTNQIEYDKFENCEGN
jgi:hypothetical protein